MENHKYLHPRKKPLLIVQMGKTFPEISTKIGDFTDWIQNVLDTKDIDIIDAKKETLPNPLRYSGIILTGSHDMVTAHPSWSRKVAEWLKICKRLQTPILGICYGHQLLANTFGGWVEDHPKGLEIGSHSIHLYVEAQKDALFYNLPQTFSAYLVHYQSATQLPQDAILLASSTHEHHQAYRIGDRIWGVQFHPEFSQVAMQGYVDILSEELAPEITQKLSIDEDLMPQRILQNFELFCASTY